MGRYKTNNKMIDLNSAMSILTLHVNRLPAKKQRLSDGF